MACRDKHGSHGHMIPYHSVRVCVCVLQGIFCYLLTKEEYCLTMCIITPTTLEVVCFMFT